MNALSSDGCFDIDCVVCPRLSQFLAGLRQQYPHYYNRPVASFGVKQAHLLVVGLAPGMHGANATSRPFTGDHSGLLLYETLHRFGFSSKPVSLSADDDLELIDCRITNAVKCLPPKNKPVAAEVKACNSFLMAEINCLPEGAVLVALGSIAHDAILRARALKKSDYKFAHNVQHDLGGGLRLIDSYHCSRYNLQTKRLTTKMFEGVFANARTLLSQANHA